MTNSRIDKAQELRYPKSADPQGAASVDHVRPHYLGPHESPLSYIVFGLWKHRLSETGEAPEVRELRPVAEELLYGKKVIRRRVLAGASTLSALVFAMWIGMLTGPMFYTPEHAPQIDGQTLSENEKIFLRNHRKAEQEHVERLISLESARRRIVIMDQLKNQKGLPQPLHDSPRMRELMKQRNLPFGAIKQE